MDREKTTNLYIAAATPIAPLERQPLTATGHQTLTLSDGSRVMCLVTLHDSGRYFARESGQTPRRSLSSSRSAVIALANLKLLLEAQLEVEGCDECCDLGELCDSCYSDCQHEGESSTEFAERMFGAHS